jgi:hypothetical protein
LAACLLLIIIRNISRIINTWHADSDLDDLMDAATYNEITEDE